MLCVNFINLKTPVFYPNLQCRLAFLYFIFLTVHTTFYVKVVRTRRQYFNTVLKLKVRSLPRWTYYTDGILYILRMIDCLI